jgi:hypothetical protein
MEEHGFFVEKEKKNQENPGPGGPIISKKSRKISRNAPLKRVIGINASCRLFPAIIFFRLWRFTDDI